MCSQVGAEPVVLWHSAPLCETAHSNSSPQERLWGSRPCMSVRCTINVGARSQRNEGYHIPLAPFLDERGRGHVEPKVNTRRRFPVLDRHALQSEKVCGIVSTRYDILWRKIKRSTRYSGQRWCGNLPGEVFPLFSQVPLGSTQRLFAPIDQGWLCTSMVRKCGPLPAFGPAVGQCARATDRVQT
jgi:hypothetical protein